MRLLIVVSSLDLESGTGLAERTYQIARRLAGRGVECAILTLDVGLGAERLRQLRGASIVALPCIWRRFFLPAPGLRSMRAIVQSVKQADIVHLTGHWSVLNALVFPVLLHFSKPYVFSPGGTLAAAGRSLALKRIYNALVGRALVRRASGWIAVTPGEFPEFRGYGIEPSSVTILPNGIEACAPIAAEGSAAAKLAGKYAPYLLYVGRLHHVKGPDLLLRAFRDIATRFADLKLVFVGPDDGLRPALEQAASSSHLGERVAFLGYREGAEKDAAFRGAELLVIPSRKEAMSLVALEAAIVGTPVLLTDQCGFDEISRIDPRLVAPATADGLARHLSELLQDRSGLRRIGGALKDYVAAHFGWDPVIGRYIALLSSILETRSARSRNG